MIPVSLSLSPHTQIYVSERKNSVTGGWGADLKVYIGVTLSGSLRGWQLNSENHII